MTKKTKTRQDILTLLKTDGPTSAAAMAERFGVTAMAIRQHLYDLQAEGLVGTEEQARPVGRPVKLWHLSERANRYFPDAHADLAVGLINAIRTSLGDEAMDALITERSHRQKADYRALMSGAETLSDRLERLTEQRNREGYMAAMSADAGEYLFIENHCPICSAAQSCSGLCAMELEVFRDALGPDCQVDRVDHILAGARRCAYRVTPKG
ncbi:transcriptional regulator [Rhodospirillaceae bacterium KN72]|uniref:Transcriptional regulator n=1 Tax=Pacificispira spongiicola TaxID=2729598 RepID=A0A7Y0E1N5_9PROT|nr:metalloregulator ArsR/SmtB family transcription factor [Pacificispira spongiicola]NMM45513.1 transcriptional regulator [Pacificispira spongiicola]